MIHTEMGHSMYPFWYISANGSHLDDLFMTIKSYMYSDLTPLISEEVSYQESYMMQ